MPTSPCQLRPKSPVVTLGEVTPGRLYFVELVTSTVTAVPLSDRIVELMAVQGEVCPGPAGKDGAIDRHGDDPMVPLVVGTAISAVAVSAVAVATFSGAVTASAVVTTAALVVATPLTTATDVVAGR